MRLKHRERMDGVEDFRRRALFFRGDLALAMLVIVAIFAPGRPAPALADGVYANKCCAAVAFKMGTVVVDGQTVPYTLQRDNLGLAAIPTFYVGVADSNRLVVERVRHPMKLRFNRSDARPSAVTIWDASTSQTYEFAKQ